MKIQPDGSAGFYSSKGIYVVLVIAGAIMLFGAFKIGISAQSTFLIPLGISAILLALGVYGLLDKRPFLSIDKDKIQILGRPAITLENIQKITVETYLEKRKDSTPAVIEYIAFYVNDLSVFQQRLTIEHNKPGTPFYIQRSNVSSKEWGLLKDTLKNIFGDKADMRNAIHKAGDAIDNISNAAKNISDAFTKWKENPPRDIDRR